MEIIRLQSVTDAQIGEILTLMRELDPEIAVTPEMVRRAVEASGTHFFAMLDGARPAGHDAGDGPHIVGCASLCVTASRCGRYHRDNRGCSLAQVLPLPCGWR